MHRTLDVERQNLSKVVPPGWPQHLMVLIGFVLLFGPLLTVLWPQ